MPFRFRRSIRLAPGIRLNIGKRGLTPRSAVAARASRSAATSGRRSTRQAPLQLHGHLGRAAARRCRHDGAAVLVDGRMPVIVTTAYRYKRALAKE
jgi:hypothetical protein